MHKGNKVLALSNLLLGLVSIVLYLPYFFEAFNMNVNGWMNVTHKLLKNNYSNILTVFGVFLLAYIVILNLASIFSCKGLSGFSLRLTAILSLPLVLLYALALQFDAVLSFWIKCIAPNIKMISLVLAIISVGLLVLGVLSCITKRRKINFYLLLQAIAMCSLLMVLILMNGWLGLDINAVKGFGILLAVLPIYLPASSILLMLYRRNYETV